MAQAFDIRFGRHSGLTALFEAPANRLRWKGDGRLSVDGGVISIAAKRGLLSLFTRRLRRIAAHDLTEVYREGDSLRLEFGTPEAREVLPIWTNGSDTAAEIVKLLPTNRTVELDHVTGSRSVYRLDRSLIACLTGCVIALVVCGWILWKPGAPAPAATSRSTDTFPIEQVPQDPGVVPQPVAAEVSQHDNPAGQLFLIARDSPSYAAARRILDQFKADLVDRSEELDEWVKSPSPVELEAMQPRWDTMIERIQRGMDYQGPELWLLRDVQISICRDWQTFEEMWAQGLRTHDVDRIDVAFYLKKRADDKLAWLDRYVP